MNIGYIWVSRDKQTTALQDAIWRTKCECVYIDKTSGRCDDRLEFLKMLDMVFGVT